MWGKKKAAIAKADEQRKAEGMRVFRQDMEDYYRKGGVRYQVEPRVRVPSTLVTTRRWAG